MLPGPCLLLLCSLLRLAAIRSTGWLPAWTLEAPHWCWQGEQWLRLAQRRAIATNSSSSSRPAKFMCKGSTRHRYRTNWAESEGQAFAQLADRAVLRRC
jgi:hypothetical protein